MKPDRIAKLIAFALLAAGISTAPAARRLPLASAVLGFEPVDGLPAIEAEPFYKQVRDGKQAEYLTTLQRASDEKPNAVAARMVGASDGDYLELAQNTRATDDDPLIGGKNFSDAPAPFPEPPAARPGKTKVSIIGEDFHLNNQPTYAGRAWQGHRIEGLLLNSRMVQATYDDLNPETASRWAYADTGKWDAERNVREFIAAMPEWKRHGLLAVTVNFQGGSPEGYSGKQAWETGAFTADGDLRPAFADRMRRVLDAADDQGMVVILGYFYFGQDQRLRDEAAVLRATDEATRWLLDGGWRNVLVEVNNETDVTAYDHDLLRPTRIHELINRVRQTKRAGRRLLVGTSYGGGSVPKENVVRASDFLLLHGNGVKEPARIHEMVKRTRAVPGYRPMPILFNEDDHENFDQPTNNFTTALQEHVSWGWFDFRRQGEGRGEGFQSPPVNWGLSSERKRAFFKLCAEITGGAKPAGMAEATTGLKGLFQRQFVLGAAIPSDNLSAGEVDLLTRNFSSVTAENIMKPKLLQPAEGRFDFDAADRFVAFAQREQLAVHGHTLVWHRQSPDWIFRDGAKAAGRELVLQRLQTHIATVVGRYAGKVASWDVVNEAIDEGGSYLRSSPWFLTAGEDYIAAAFQAARRADPAARLYYNDFDIERPLKRAKALRLIRTLKAQQVPLDGIGIQGHWLLDQVPFAELEAAIIAFHAEGLQVAITELDLDVVPRTETGDPFAAGCPSAVLQRQAKQYAQLFRLFRKHADKIERVTFWGLHDGKSWLNYAPRRHTNHPLLWSRELTPKPACDAVREVGVQDAVE